ncbi:MAG: ABC transporter permease [Candidatus Magasanikbacteria bacterium]|nr:ABC transporter permease [Candidatus Magasanikbacteria bacterium]
MKTEDLLEETYAAVTVNMVRTGLTILGIVIGISSVIAMVSIGEGAKQSIQSSIQSIGSNLILVTPGAQRGAGVQVSAGRGSAQTLTQDDATAIKTEITAAAGVAPEATKRLQVTALGTNTNTQIVGTVPDYTSVRSITVDLGSFFSDQSVLSRSKVAVIGPTTRDDLFGAGANPVGQIIRINKIEFQIIGVNKAKGGSGFTSQDDMIFIPITTAQQYLIGNQYVTTISVQAPDQTSMPSIQQSVTDLLMQRHKISDPTAADFSVLNQADIVATASSVTDIFTTLLGSIAGISLLVGGIGIMNMMLTTVTERTREIGLRKAIGAQNHDISFQFLAESVLLTTIGGVLGIFLGWLIALAVTQFAGIATNVSFSSVVLACGVSMAIGLIFGYYPSRRAAHLNPIEALRYE